MRKKLLALFLTGALLCTGTAAYTAAEETALSQSAEPGDGLEVSQDTENSEGIWQTEAAEISDWRKAGERIQKPQL